MNQGRIWCVVKPTVGLPLFIGGVLVVSLLVHTSLLFNTTWYPAFFQGGKSSGPVAEAPATPEAATLASQ